jgi:tRNA(Ile2) C34 agmatinyltransferase TiaS
MSGAAPAPPATAPESASLFAAAGVERGGRTLEDSVLAAWRELRVRGTASCLVCGGALEADGACRECGSELS